MHLAPGRGSALTFFGGGNALAPARAKRVGSCSQSQVGSGPGIFELVFGPRGRSRHIFSAGLQLHRVYHRHHLLLEVIIGWGVHLLIEIVAHVVDLFGGLFESRFNF